MSERRQIVLMLTPYVFGLAALVAAPALVTFGLAFTEYDLIRPPELNGFDVCTAIRKKSDHTESHACTLATAKRLNPSAQGSPRVPRGTYPG